ncbi:MAG: ASCH domain-containing protein [Bacteroidetes bacterium]|nr:ASCH domain-containing protein [Flavobacteriales bacterium]NOG57272.1 ASCH domain-containing protein [Bacteroidota bacterium]
MWEAFQQENENYLNKDFTDSFYFCDQEKEAKLCAKLVQEGIKQATSTSLWWFDKHEESLPEVGNIYVITDWYGIAKAIVETTKVEQIPFNQVDENYAMIEGEGDKTLADWKKTHWEYYTREMEPFGEEPSEDMLIVCEQFKTIWK